MNTSAAQFLQLPTTSFSSAPPLMVLDARHGPVQWMPTWRSRSQQRLCRRLWTSPCLLDWKSGMAGNTEEEEETGSAGYKVIFFCGRSAVLRPSVHMLPGIGWCSAGLPPFSTACWWLTHPSAITGVSVSARLDSPGGCGGPSVPLLCSRRVQSPWCQFAQDHQ